MGDVIRLWRCPSCKRLLQIAIVRCPACGRRPSVAIDEFARRIMNDARFARFVFERLTADQKAAFVECFGFVPNSFR